MVIDQMSAKVGNLDHKSAADQWLTATARTHPWGAGTLLRGLYVAYAPAGRGDGSIVVGACLGPNDEGM
jgi:hypothetical protein